MDDGLRRHMLSQQAPESLRQLADELRYIIGPEREEQEHVDVFKPRLVRWEQFIRDFIKYHGR